MPKMTYRTRLNSGITAFTNYDSCYAQFCATNTCFQHRMSVSAQITAVSWPSMRTPCPTISWQIDWSLEWTAFTNSIAFQSRPVREFPGIAEPKIPGGNSREFLKFWRELRGIYRSFVFYPIFIVMTFNLTYCIMCTTHDGLTAFWAKPWMTSLTQLFVFRVPVYFQTLISKITEQRQNFANSDRYTRTLR